MTTKEFAQKLGISPSRVRFLAASRRIKPFVKLKTQRGFEWVFYDNSVILKPLRKRDTSVTK